MIRLTIERETEYKIGTNDVSKIIIEESSLDNQTTVSDLVEFMFEPAIYAMGYSSIFKLIVDREIVKELMSENDNEDF